MKSRTSRKWDESGFFQKWNTSLMRCSFTVILNLYLLRKVWIALFLHSLEAHCEPLLSNDELCSSMEFKFEYKISAPAFVIVADSSFCSLSNISRSTSLVLSTTHNCKLVGVRSGGTLRLISVEGCTWNRHFFLYKKCDYFTITFST